MKRIIIHWTAGAYQPNQVDYEHYHYLINGDGLVIAGKHKPEDNESTLDGNYAAHTGGGNTGAIGIAMCGMLGFKNRKEIGSYPLKAKQCERCFKLIAELCKKYDIPITANTVLTHYEFGKKYPTTSSGGKIDIIYLPEYSDIEPDKIGRFIRAKARWYYERL